MNFRFWLTSTSSTRSGWFDEHDLPRAESGRNQVAVLSGPAGHRAQLVAAELLQIAEEPVPRADREEPAVAACAMTDMVFRSSLAARV